MTWRAVSARPFQLSQSDNPESAPLVFVGIMDAPVSVLEFEPTVTSAAERPRWDGFCASGRSVHRYNQDCATSEVVFKVRNATAGLLGIEL